LTDKFVDRLPAPEIAGVVIPWFTPADLPTPDRLKETSGLVEALGCQLGFVRPDQIRQVNPSFLLSGGIIDRMAADLDANNCTIAVIDGTLSPVQQRNLEKRLERKVIDRTGLILEIFGLRARTKEGRLQVELARILYERSRLVRTWTHLERQRGGSGFLSGPGESQLEADRRMLDDRIVRLKRDLDEVKRTRAVQRSGRRRLGTPVITSAACSVSDALDRSRTCTSKSACKDSSSVAWKLSIRWVGRSVMKPTVSIRAASPSDGKTSLRIVGSRVANGMSLANTSAPVSRLNRVDLPELV
jgi:GTP-binding GTPase Middle Region/GTP-binding GTPase N-terminal